MGLVGYKQLNVLQTLATMAVLLALTLLVRRGFDVTRGKVGLQQTSV
jgi:hypothetical protein